MRLAFGSRTDIGRTRKRNEDSMLVREPLFVVADGMGGHRGGNVASAMTVEVLGVAPVATGGTAAVVDTIRTANRAVLERGDAEPELQGMGTTVTALFVDVDADMGHVAHVGDSRAYLLRRGALQQLTRGPTRSCRSWSGRAGSPRRTPNATHSGASSPARSASTTRWMSTS